MKEPYIVCAHILILNHEAIHYTVVSNAIKTKHWFWAYSSMVVCLPSSAQGLVSDLQHHQEM